MDGISTRSIVSDTPILSYYNLLILLLSFPAFPSTLKSCRFFEVKKKKERKVKCSTEVIELSTYNVNIRLYEVNAIATSAFDVHVNVFLIPYFPRKKTQAKQINSRFCFSAKVCCRFRIHLTGNCNLYGFLKCFDFNLRAERDIVWTWLLQSNFS